MSKTKPRTKWKKVKMAVPVAAIMAGQVFDASAACRCIPQDTPDGHGCIVLGKPTCVRIYDDSLACFYVNSETVWCSTICDDGTRYSTPCTMCTSTDGSECGVHIP